MNYQVVLPYNKKVTVDEDEKSKIEDNLENGGLVQIRGQWIDVSAIRGIYEVGYEDKNREEEIEEANKHRQQIRREFEQKCVVWRDQSPKAKAERELRSRMGGILKLTNCTKESQEVQDCYRSALWFFRTYPEYPWYPFQHWKHLVRDRISSFRMAAHFVQIIKRHDAQMGKLDKGFYKTVEMAEEIFGAKAQDVKGGEQMRIRPDSL